MPFWKNLVSHDRLQKRVGQKLNLQILPIIKDIPKCNNFDKFGWFFSLKIDFENWLWKLTLKIDFENQILAPPH